jgi:hypothetical protein
MNMPVAPNQNKVTIDLNDTLLSVDLDNTCLSSEVSITEETMDRLHSILHSAGDWETDFNTFNIAGALLEVAGALHHIARAIEGKD